MKKYLLVALSLVLVMGFAGTSSAVSTADIGFVIDQSGSMSGEFAWLGSSITGIDTQVQAGGVTANYGVAGYEFYAGSADVRNAWQDITSSVAAVVSEVNSVNVYGGTERGYHAADWSTDNFSWTGGTYAKVLVLITDEPNDYRSSYAYGGLTGEAALAKKMSDNNILLNVITFQGYYGYWDDAVYSKDSYSGLFDLNYLRTNPSGFTTDFTTAKLQEIKDVPVPEPGILLLTGIGLACLAFSRKKS